MASDDIDDEFDELSGPLSFSAVESRDLFTAYRAGDRAALDALLLLAQLFFVP